ncbi:MAG: acetolactate synthase large subunit, partial [Proteobacteria bacterium]|nr:acetolactate synthase large subunit [Pseudomonadota bacterium]
DGYARMADKPAATLLHLGPGLANGLANLHNARRANTPMVNVVGDHATDHLAYDAPLTSDIESLARPMSHWVGRVESADTVGSRTSEAIAAARAAPGQISTLILPADAAWSQTTASIPATLAKQQPTPPDDKAILAAATALRSGASTTIIATGLALREKQLALLGRIAAKTGARLMAQQSNGRIQRGAGRVAVDRVPYVVDQAVAAFADTRQVLLVGAKAPVAFFAYPGKPSSMLPPDCVVLELANRGSDVIAAVEALAEAVGVAGIEPSRNRRERPAVPQGELTPDAISIALARHMPPDAIVCDESVTSGRNFFHATHGAEPHDFLQLTGGSIGIGLPLAAGAAIACPNRKVIALQADGSGMYTLQALWTHARERLDIVTIVYSNRRYQILLGELKSVGASAPGRNASRMLNLDDPDLDWVSLAKGMGVEAARADTCEAFETLLKAAVGRRGPFLIEAVI